MLHRANVLLAACLLGCSMSTAFPAEPPVPFKPVVVPFSPPRLASIQSGNAGKRFGDEMECLLEPHLVTSLGSPVEGTLSEVLVDRGGRQWVKSMNLTPVNDLLPEVWTGFEADGRLLGTFSIPHPPRPKGPLDSRGRLPYGRMAPIVMEFSGNTVLMRTQDDEGAAHFTLFRLKPITR